MNPTPFSMPFLQLQAEIVPQQTALRTAITEVYRRDEADAVQWLLANINPHSGSEQTVHQLAHQLVSSVRQQRTRASGVDALMHEFSLSSEEGVALMCLAEALLRIPDHQTADRLIADKISKGDWAKHLGESPSLFVNAATWGLLVTGKLVSTNSEQGLGSALTRLIAKGGEPLIRKGVDLAMRMLGNQFVTGQTIQEAIKNSQDNEKRGYRYSYDMLGEAALTAHDAAYYLKSYETAIHAIGKASNGRGIKDGPGISVKLSALHPRYSRAQKTRTMTELLPILKNLLVLAKQYNIGLNIDAEETDRLELSLDLMEALAFDPDLAGFDGLGFVVQAYQKRCPFVIDYLVDLARRSGRKFMVRLVKGAYWDAEIKRAQVDGMSGFPVYTRKVYTDVSYLFCAQKLLLATDVVYPQFATHNALTLSAIYTWAQKANITDYEFQCLHGMGETLYDQVVGKDKLNKPCRIYAPVGSHQTLLAYLVRRLLENGANSSFVNQIVDEAVSIESLIADPVQVAKELAGTPHPGIALPQDLFGAERKNSAGLDFSNEIELQKIGHYFAEISQQEWIAQPLLHGQVSATLSKPVNNPADHSDIVGKVIEANQQDVQTALEQAESYALDWQTVAPSERAGILKKAADLLEAQTLDFMALAIREAGKSLPNALAEVREAVDFLRYYAAQVEFLPNTLALGPVVCISPWNFPLAIFIGEVSAALAVGNVVLAKPAEQTPIIAYRAIQLLHEAGVPRAALQFLPGTGEIVGAQLVADHRVKGVIFTGSTEVAQIINRTLTQRAITENIDLPLIAETGGQNAMIVDSSALPEQVVNDVLSSAFDSAGQRCSALRVLCLQEDIADKTIEMLKGAMQELRIGKPNQLAIDIGPVIDADAQKALQAHIDQIKQKATTSYSLALSDSCKNGTFIAPTVIEIKSLSELTKEVFGPVLHILRYQRDQLASIINNINASGFGLTLGIHSRIDETIDFITSRAHVGNIYVNRNIVGAVVGVQPFGGEGKSGTGPKAGGPLYLKRLQKNPSSSLGGHTVYERQSPEALEALLVWAKTHGHEKIAELADRYAHHSPYKMTLVLPGPTGERNTLSFAPRGKVFCAASTVNCLLNQIAALLATGNTPVMPAQTIALLPSGLPVIVRDLIKQSEAGQDELQFALVEGNQLGHYKSVFAAQNGAIVSVIEMHEETEAPLWRLVAERALCVNTTAAGGNASLMTLQS
ncbi:trifunctional transcriptional regulator/proline dehydrogenase/L-glutamate gamma-semialdehyde dehydrogenase [Undibacterium sp. 5I1]|uniref:trifunctional transcriptional regulator/proline dehydrogenase/L-glutamate gamma-semialdehyde dehydrogenase n=1 Tax=unclassified Undibacterium TaxID=2630295 RepID=UPI002AB3885C|nr:MULTISPECIES: trifunctional transcriptional regulator/proline dehydrogenase/L-glutamate gamma-semialdehyde dehydrogenase [unclassified Undibacterium]MDY7539736.1 trifunctional transcriptional regulator/proline dehydrogenase/L-glutamate gamma-semialdehyde dehydrogenase [Undibacterium sp. 5I1]MEB0230834.1 trifunctional transcriptional regulator/proline dehydrogenase/L-glutamate gamma-semialdehyde dehydrogenase [Undibacterium sp. 10I3]MEB0256771.1 trifunctional transcriptional regulator/proline 